MDEKDLKALSRALASLKVADKRVTQSLGEICEKASKYGEQARAAHDKLSSAQAMHTSQQTVAVSERAERELLARVDEAARLLKVAKGVAPTLKRAIEAADRAARRIGSSSDASVAVTDALVALLRDLGDALDTALTRCLHSSDATALWRAARSRTLDGSVQHAGLDSVRALLGLMAQLDAVEAPARADALSAPGGRCQRGRARLLEDACARATEELQAACRLAATGSEAAQSHGGDSFPPAFLPALAEAASAAYKVPYASH